MREPRRQLTPPEPHLDLAPHDENERLLALSTSSLCPTHATPSRAVCVCMRDLCTVTLYSQCGVFVSLYVGLSLFLAWWLSMRRDAGWS